MSVIASFIIKEGTKLIVFLVLVDIDQFHCIMPFASSFTKTRFNILKSIQINVQANASYTRKKIGNLTRNIVAEG